MSKPVYYIAANPDTVETAAGPDTFVFRMLPVFGLRQRIHLSVGRPTMEAALVRMDAERVAIDRELAPLIDFKPGTIQAIPITREKRKALLLRAMEEVRAQLLALEPTLDLFQLSRLFREYRAFFCIDQLHG